MRKVLITAATFKPLIVEEVKLRPELKIDGQEDDLVIADLIDEAVETYEEYTDGVLCRSTWDVYLDEFRHEIILPAPLHKVLSVSYLDSMGEVQTLDESVYTIDASDPMCARIAPRSGRSWPRSCAELNAVTVRVEAGYANPGSIPQRIKSGLILRVQEIYDGTDRTAAYEACWRRYRRIHV